MISTRGSCNSVVAAYRAPSLSYEDTTPTTDGRWIPGGGWLTSAPKMHSSHKIKRDDAMSNYQ